MLPNNKLQKVKLSITWKNLENILLKMFVLSTAATAKGYSRT